MDAYRIFQRLVLITILVCYLPSLKILAQENIHHRPTTYQWPDDPLVMKNLENWRDLKFGIIIHWGLYAVPGIIESWELCSEDWINRDSTISYEDYKKWYWGLEKNFNPFNFDPEQWADAAKKAGMRYLVFTTKHHDGFCMFDTKQTDFKITAGPFKNHPRSDVAKHVFEAFRKNDFLIGAYFSKPDWHSEYYWWSRYATPDRNNNYDIRKNPWRWDKFKTFTYNQIQELVTGYGRIDILWLDGGWVRPLETVNDEVRAWGAAIPAWSQDINIPRIAAMARKEQPGLLIVDRTVHGPYENYQTPEQSIPAEKLEHPWESCITLGNAWGYSPNDEFKSATTVIHKLIEVVAKGGNLLLGVGPNADGRFTDLQVERLTAIGKWLKTNGKAIYNTRPAKHYRDAETFFTVGKDSTVYVLVPLKENTPVPGTLVWKLNVPEKRTRITLLSTGKNVKWKLEDKQVKVFLSLSMIQQNQGSPALVFSFKE